ncbi:MAG: hypothetical protein GY778_30930 [bacterium]|nr:hypothetical protein [bacterium]
MEAPLRLPNPIWWAQLRLIGGRRIGWIVGAWALALVVCPQTIRRFAPAISAADILAVLAIVQCLLMLLGGCSECPICYRVGESWQGDETSKPDPLFDPLFPRSS